jgi:hypothetical protein
MDATKRPKRSHSRAAWIDRKNPFLLDADVPTDYNRSLERFLAFLVTQFSGGTHFSVSDVHAFAGPPHRGAQHADAARRRFRFD